MEGIFITGTDTDVGKSLFTAGLTSLLRGKGLNCVAIKPVETGCKMNQGELEPQDGIFLRHASGKILDLDDTTPFRFSMPAAPYRAAAMQGSRLRISDIVEHVRVIQNNHDLVIVEGAGGLLAQIEEKRTMVDLVTELGFPVFLVARTRLGTINHTLLSFEALERRNIDVLGVVLSKSQAEEGPEEVYTAGDIRRMVKETPVFELPFISEGDKNDPEKISGVLRKISGEDDHLEKIVRSSLFNAH
jgi:dethiobiotin synthetase